VNRFFAYLLVCLFLFGGGVHAVESPAAKADYEALQLRLAAMQQVEREAGQALFTGRHLVFDYDRRQIQLEHGVRVVDDRGVLTAEKLVGRFSAEHTLSTIEAESEVSYEGEGFHVSGERAVYDHAGSTLDLVGRARVTHLESGNQLAGGHIKVWLTEGARRVECEPNARLLLLDTQGFSLEGVEAMEGYEGGLGGVTDIRANQFVYDEAAALVSLNGSVWVMNPQASLTCGRAQIQLTGTRELKSVAAEQEVVIRSGGREAAAEAAQYDHEEGQVLLYGHATVRQGDNSLFGERIRFWLAGSRKLICEPNALLAIRDAGAFSVGKKGEAEPIDTEIRADRLVVDEEQGVAECSGRVRLRDLRGGMNCERLRLYLKEDNEIDWIEASSEVIIQSGDRKALADRASYYVQEGKFVLEGTPTLKQGDNIMTGDRITFWQESMRMVCEPNARVLLFPDAEMKEKFLKGLEE
jgi:lipopolysaccharide transport protein LptA